MKTHLIITHLFLFLFCVAKSSIAQDIIILNNGEEIKAKNITLKGNQLSYVSNNDTQTTEVSQILMIKKVNGDISYNFVEYQVPETSTLPQTKPSRSSSKKEKSKDKNTFDNSLAVNAIVPFLQEVNALPSYYQVFYAEYERRLGRRFSLLGRISFSDSEDYYYSYWGWGEDYKYDYESYSLGIGSRFYFTHPSQLKGLYLGLGTNISYTQHWEWFESYNYFYEGITAEAYIQTGWRQNIGRAFFIEPCLSLLSSTYHEELHMNAAFTLGMRF